MGGYSDIFMEQGADYLDTINLTTDDGSPVNITGYTFSSQMRRSYYSSYPSANIQVTIEDGPNGVAQLYLDSANTANIPAGRYFYDVYMVDTFAGVSRLIEGVVFLSSQTTLGNNLPIQQFGGQGGLL